MSEFNMKQWLQENRVGPYNTVRLTESEIEEDREHPLFAKLQPSDEEYQIKRDEQGNIIQATNKEGDVFKKGDKAKTHENGTIEIKSFIGSQGKVKAVYYSQPGLVAHEYDIDGLSKVMGEQIGVGYVAKVKPSDPGSGRF